MPAKYYRKYLDMTTRKCAGGGDAVVVKTKIYKEKEQQELLPSTSSINTSSPELLELSPRRKTMAYSCNMMVPLTIVERRWHKSILATTIRSPLPIVT